MKMTKVGGTLFNKGAVRYGAGIFLAFVLLLVVLSAGFGSSSLTVDDRIASKDYVDVGITENKEAMKISLDLVEKGLTRKCLLVDSWDDTLGLKDVSFYLRDNNFVPGGKAELYSVETREKIVPKNFVYEDVPYSCTIFDNDTMAEIESTCYKSELKSYENVTEYYDTDVSLDEFDLGTEMEAGSLDFNAPKRLKICFNTPIVETAAGWGNAGTLYVKIGDSLLVDKQHSSWWRSDFAFKRDEFVTHSNSGNLTNYTFLSNGTSGFNLGNPDETQWEWCLAPNVNETYTKYYNNNSNRATVRASDNTTIQCDEEYGSTSLINKNAYGSGILSVYHLSTLGGANQTTDVIGRLNGTVAGGTVVSGKFGNAIDLSGSGSYIDIGDADLPNDFTVEMWFKADTLTGTPHQYLIDKAIDAPNHIPINYRLLIVGNTGVITGGITDNAGAGNANCDSGSKTITAGQWYHIAQVRDTVADQMYVYINGSVWCNVTDGTTTSIAGNQSAILGATGQHGQPLDGMIDEVRMWNKALSSAEIKRNFEQGLSVLGDGEEYNEPPTTPSPALSPTTAYTTTNLNCSSFIYDADSESMDAFFNLTVGGSYVSQYTLLDQPNGSSPSWIIDSGNYTKNDAVRCYMKLFDGKDYSDSNYTEITISNTEPEISSYNASNATYTYNDLQNVTFQENDTENKTFTVTVSDADVNEGADNLWYNWFVDNIWRELTQNNWFNWIFNFTTAGSHTVRVDVNDTENEMDSQTWNVNVANVVNKQWSVDYVSPTPSDGANLPGSSVTISASVTPTVLKEAAPKAITDDAMDFNSTGTLTGMQMNSTDNSVQLSYPNYAGNYISVIYDAGENVSWDNMSWSELLPVDGELEPSSDTVAIWHMNEGSGNILDTSVNLNNGTVNGGVTYGVNGSFNTALQFGGTNGYVEVPDSNSLDLTNNLTIQAWIKTSAASIQGIIYKGSNSSDDGNYGLIMDTNGKIQFNIGARTLQGIKVINDNQWHHVAATFVSTDKDAMLYVDGVLDKSDTSFIVTPSANANPVWIGKWYSMTPGTNYFNGLIDEAGIWNRALNSTEILRNYNAKLTNVTFQVRSCDDASCSGETFGGPSGVTSYYTNAMHEPLVGVDANRYFQYEVFLETNRVNLTPKLYDVTIRGHTPEVVEDVSISSAWIDFNHTNYSMSGSGNSWSYTNGALLVGSYSYKVYANDTFGNINSAATRSFTVPSYEIYFNVTDGDTGIGIDLIDMITCNYGGFNKGSDNNNTYGPYTFPVGSWTCTFVKGNYWNETIDFIANEPKIVDVIISSHGGLSYEEHTQLDWLYNCWKNGNCWDLLTKVNQTVSKVWQQYLPTDKSVVLQEENLSLVLTETNDISINYTIAVPYKEGYDVGTLLPIRIFYWFTDDNGKCYDQDKQTSATNRAETPYCIPLIAEYLGPNNGTTSFKVDLHPNLPDGTYNVVRSIDIDPPVNGEPVWINYGRELIGTINVVNQVKAAAQTVDETKEMVQTVEAKAPVLPSLNAVTGKVVEKIKSTGGIYGLIALAMICSTILGITFIRARR